VLARGGVDASGEAALGLSFLATRRVRVDALARVPVIAARIDAPEGSARIGTAFLGGGLSLAMTDADSFACPSIGAGMAIGWTHVEGSATPPYVSHSDDLFAAMPYVRVATSLRLAGRLRVRADVLGAARLSSEAVAFAGRQAAVLGDPLVDVSLGLEVLW
jgi:hypothetical protein